MICHSYFWINRKEVKEENFELANDIERQSLKQELKEMAAKYQIVHSGKKFESFCQIILMA